MSQVSQVASAQFGRLLGLCVLSAARGLLAIPSYPAAERFVMLCPLTHWYRKGWSHYFWDKLRKFSLSARCSGGNKLSALSLKLLLRVLLTVFYQSCPLCGLCMGLCHKSDGTKSYRD